jgi:opacity protein-like surface antigen
MKKIILSLALIVSFTISAETLYEKEHIAFSFGKSANDTSCNSLGFFAGGCIETNPSDDVYSLAYGFRLNNNLIELSYQDLGTSATSSGIMLNFHSGASDMPEYMHEYSSIEIKNISEFQLTNNFNAYFKFGLSYLSVDDSSYVPVSIAIDTSYSNSSLELAYGLGFNFNLNDKVNFFVELMDSNHSVKSEKLDSNDKIELGSHYLVGLKFKL